MDHQVRFYEDSEALSTPGVVPATSMGNLQRQNESDDLLKVYS